MRVTMTGATGLIGTRIVAALRARGDEVTVLSRDPDTRTRAARRGRRGERLGPAHRARRRPPRSPAATASSTSPASRSRSAGAPSAKERIRDEPRDRHREPRRRPARDRAAPGACSSPPPPSATTAPAATSRSTRPRRPAATSSPRSASHGSARRWLPSELGMRVALLRTGVVLDADGGALAKMLPPFRAGVGGPVAGGAQYMPWIHVDDLVGLYLAALDARGLERADQRLRAEARDEPRVLEGARPRAAPPGRRAGSRALACGCSTARWQQIVTTGQRAVPAARARARLRLPAPRAGRGAALRAHLSAGTHRGLSRAAHR